MIATSSPRTQCLGRVLIVDGNLPLLALFSTLLEAEGYHVETATSGQEALSVAANFRPKVAFVCTELPLMSGAELARAFRQTGHHDLVIVAITTHTEMCTTPQWQMAEFAHVLRKPVQVEQLLDVLASVQAKTGQTILS